MEQLVGFCAQCSNTGKTTLILRLLEELKSRGISAAVIKHSHHVLSDKGKDSKRFLTAGAEASMFVTPTGWILESHPGREPEPERAAALLRELTGCGIVLVEGWRHGAFPKIALCRERVTLELPCPEEELSAVVCDVPFSTSLPCFGYEDISALCDFILTL